MAPKRKLLFVAAHPDDAEFCAGGLISAWSEVGHLVKILCLTNGNAGHHKTPPDELAKRRAEEAKSSADIIGAELEIWDQPDGELTPSVRLHSLICTGSYRHAQSCRLSP